MPTDKTPPAPRPVGDQVSLVDSFKRLAAWLKEHDAAVLMQSLSPGAKPIQLSKLEHKLGFTVPKGLRALWLMHDGQRRGDEAIIGTLQLLPIAWVLNERAATLALLKRFRAEPDQLKKSGLSADEAQSDQWFPVAKRGKDCVIVNAISGRVFAGGESAPYLKLLAGSVPQWLANYVEAVERDEYALVLGPDGAFLEPRFE
ncbi:MAG: SMI1/KNR4 family protein [Archangium sp.]|nr:SMI1/KNR4 family protein [Archangium sp.]